MTSQITNLLREYRKLSGSLPAIQNTSQKIRVYDRYLSEGGEEKDSRDYFEIQRIVEGGEPSATNLPPKIPLRSDYTLMSEAILYYLRAKGKTKISTSNLKGFLLPKNISQGEFNSIKEAANRDVPSPGRMHVFRSSSEENIIDIEVIVNKLDSLLGSNSITKIKQWLNEIDSSTAESEEPAPQIESARHLTVQEKIISEVQSRIETKPLTTDTQIDGLDQIQKFVISQLNEGSENAATTLEEADEVIRAIASI